MSTMTGREYIESLRALKPEVYFLGRKIKNIVDEPMFHPHLHGAAMTYELAHHPEYANIMTAPSHLTGEKINRFTHVHQSIDDLVKKVRMMRLLGQKTGTCFQRCVGLDGLNALYVTTYDLRENLRTMGLEADLIPEGEKPVDVVLLVNGCRHACLEKEYPESGRGCPVISLRGEMVDDQYVAEGDIVKILIARLGSLG